MQNAGNGQDAKKRTTFIEEGSSFKGEFSSDCPIVVKGRIEGNITGPSLTVSATGAVAGMVKVGVIECEGELAGQFEADVVKLSGRVRDNTVIRAKSLEVKLSPEKGMLQVVFGECNLEVGDMPSKEAVLSDAQARAVTLASAGEPAPAPQPGVVQTAEEPQQAASAPAAGEGEASAAEDADDDKVERRNGTKKGARVRPSNMPPPLT
jgi:cytoskeletal protein CcmA (bactofilin family)